MQWEVTAKVNSLAKSFDSDQARPIVGLSGSKLFNTLMVLHCITEVNL